MIQCRRVAVESRIDDLRGCGWGPVLGVSVLQGVAEKCG